MITLRCTKKLRDFLGTTPTEPLLPTTSTLGDWYANLIPTYAGDLILIVNEKTLLAVAIPVWEAENLLPLFRMRVYNLLRLIGIKARVASKEMGHYYQVQFAKTASRSVLGSMNECSYAILYRVDPEYGGKNYSISDLEVWLSDRI
ncbi:MAG: hypothetical protein K8R77_16345 [Anaerolineaceae bacterium]|nr:hypothetical protein [Anaerolineaceae bacterium]